MISKNCLLFLLLLITGPVVSAQTQFGVRGGFNLSSLVLSDAEDVKAVPGFHAGVFMKKSVSRNCFFSPDLIFSSKGAKEASLSFVQIKRLMYIDLPLMIEVLNESGYSFFAGPHVSFLMFASSEGELEIIQPFGDNDLRTLDTGIVLGAGMMLTEDMYLNCRLGYGIPDIRCKSHRETADMSGHNLNFELSVGIHVN